MQDQQQQVQLIGTTPIQALPPAAAIDLDVLDALPLHLKRELERAYGEVKHPFSYPAIAGTFHARSACGLLEAFPTRRVLHA